MTPPTVRFAVPLVVTVRLAGSGTAPVPRFKSFEPPKVKLPLQVCGFAVVRETDVPLVLSIAPPAITSPPVPSAELLLMFN